jgi:ABC-2 type transport system permease protein
MKNALIIFKKEIKEVLKSRGIWVPSIVLSLIFAVIMPIALSVGSGSLLKDPDTAKLLSRILAGNEPFTALVMFLSKQLLVFLLLVPAMIPSLIAPTSITLEKESRTLEPLLATPIKTSELLLGKTLTSIIPAFVISTFNFILLSVTIDIVSFSKLGYLLLPNTEWLIIAFILSPAISFIITMVSITISSKTTDIKAAQGIGSAVILPIYAIIGMQIGGLFVLNSVYLLIASLVLIALCPVFLKIAIRVFDREHILTKWKYK